MQELRFVNLICHPIKINLEKIFWILLMKINKSGTRSVILTLDLASCVLISNNRSRLSRSILTEPTSFFIWLQIVFTVLPAGVTNSCLASFQWSFIVFSLSSVNQSASAVHRQEEVEEAGLLKVGEVEEELRKAKEVEEAFLKASAVAQEEQTASFHCGRAILASVERRCCRAIRKKTLLLIVLDYFGPSSSRYRPPPWDRWNPCLWSSADNPRCCSRWSPTGDPLPSSTATSRRASSPASWTTLFAAASGRPSREWRPVGWKNLAGRWFSRIDFLTV